jgi:hypothetical protein
MSKHTLNEWFEELVQVLKRRTIFINQGDDPVYFLVYPPRWSLDAYELLPTWESMLRHADYAPRVFNIGLALTKFLQNHKYKDTLICYERSKPQDLKGSVKSVTDLLQPKGGPHIAENWIQEELDATVATPGGILIITGIELLHPYLQIGRIEQRLQGKFKVPTIVLYPGTRTGTFGLQYLGIYPPDGNYRSKHVGGTNA